MDWTSDSVEALSNFGYKYSLQKCASVSYTHLTEENGARFTAFATDEERINWHMFGEHRPRCV